VFNKSIFNYLSSPSDVLEKYPLETLAKEGRLSAFKHKDYWQCMDTVRDKNQLNELWINNKAPWKTW
jgi:glucose-1-phosphate cytidylyltransferase